MAKRMCVCEFERERVYCAWRIDDWAIEKELSTHTSNMHSTSVVVNGPVVRTEKFENFEFKLQLQFRKNESDWNVWPALKLSTETFDEKGVVVSGKISVTGSCIASARVVKRLTSYEHARGPEVKASEMTSSPIFIIADFDVINSRLPFHYISVPDLKRFKESPGVSANTPVEKLQSELGDLVFSNLHCDLKIRVRDVEFNGHKAVFAARSPVFRAMLNIPMREQLSSVVDIADTSPDSWKRFQEFLYTAKVNLNGVSINGHIELLLLAIKYQVESLAGQVEALIFPLLSVDNAVKVYQVADRLQLQSLKDMAANLLVAYLGLCQFKKDIDKKEKVKRQIKTDPELMALVIDSL